MMENNIFFLKFWVMSLVETDAELAPQFTTTRFLEFEVNFLVHSAYCLISVRGTNQDQRIRKRTNVGLQKCRGSRHAESRNDSYLDSISGLFIQDRDVSPFELLYNLDHGFNLVVIGWDCPGKVLEPLLIAQLGARREEGNLKCKRVT